jgi:hypothetical protein
VGTTFYIAPELLSGQRIGPTEVRRKKKTKFYLFIHQFNGLES